MSGPSPLQISTPPPHVVGGQPSGNPPTADPAGGDDAQARINEIAAAEHAKGVRAGRSTMLRSLGFSTVEEATTFLESARAGAQSATEAQQQLSKAQADAARLTAENRTLKATTDVATALSSAGVKGERLTRAVQAVLADLSSNAIEAPTPDAITAAVATFKTEMPELFASAPGTPGTPPVPPATTPPAVPGVTGLQGGTIPPGTQHAPDPKAAADAEFERRFGRQLRQANAPTS